MTPFLPSLIDLALARLHPVIAKALNDMCKV